MQPEERGVRGWKGTGRKFHVFPRISQQKEFQPPKQAGARHLRVPPRCRQLGRRRREGGRAFTVRKAQSYTHDLQACLWS